MLAAAAFAWSAGAQDNPLPSVGGIYRHYIEQSCDGMIDATRAAVTAQRHNVPQIVAKDILTGMFSLGTSAIPENDIGIRDEIRASFSDYLPELIGRAYSPGEYSWHSPRSTNLCVWSIDNCVRSVGSAVSYFFDASNNDVVRRHITFQRNRWGGFLNSCQPPFHYCPEADDPLWWALAARCQRKVGNYPND